MNGKRGVATDFHWYEDGGKWRYTAKLNGGEASKAKPAEGAGGGYIRPATLKINRGSEENTKRLRNCIETRVGA